MCWYFDTMNYPQNVALERQRLDESHSLNEGEEHHYRLWQDYTSPYSQKVMAYLHYKGIAYKRIQTTRHDYMTLIPSLVGRSIIPLLVTPDNTILQDSTPTIEWLEERHPKPASVPTDPRLAFVMWICEEFADEYLPRIHMHTRWGCELNRTALSHRIARGLTRGEYPVDHTAFAEQFAQRQSGFDFHLGIDCKAVRESLDQQIQDLLAILEAHFLHYNFLLGFRPSIADFAFFGPLRTHLFNDPASAVTMEVHAPRTCRWLDTISELGDQRGCASPSDFGDWLKLDSDYVDTLHELLRFIGKTFLPFALGNVDAEKLGQKRYSAVIDGVNTQLSTRKYRNWSFEQLQLRYQTIKSDYRPALETLLIETGIQPHLMSGGIYHNGLLDESKPPVCRQRWHAKHA
ncbi:MAG: glutathione S-transferase [Zhongshania sp.]|jgi:glutathione S-transferase